MSKSCCTNISPVSTRSCCDFPTLVVLILIILQFGKKRGSSKKIDNGILFIIALFFLSCCNPCGNMMGR